MSNSVTTTYTWSRDMYEISTDPGRLDIEVIHGFLSSAYWSQDIPKTIVERALAHSLCFGVYHEGRQIGMARVVSDYATFAYVADVFIVESYRGRGLSKWLMSVVKEHPDLQGLRRWLLATRDAHELYRQFGFAEPRWPERFMEQLIPDIYQRNVLHPGELAQ